MTLIATEFYSGIGAFAQAAHSCGIEIAAAYDQSQWANHTYHANYGLKPNSRNLDSIGADKIPHSDLWWMSPPCTPFSRRGKQRDDQDNRARSFLHLIDLMEVRRPDYILIENVGGFIGSRVHEHLLGRLEKMGYQTGQYSLCSSLFGVPMLRPRVFIVAARQGLSGPKDVVPAPVTPGHLNSYLFEEDERLNCAAEILSRYEAVLNIADPALADSYLICFTSGYQRCRQASGSLIRTGNGGARFVSPQEILALLGFDPTYKIPDTVPLEVAYKLVGNSVDVRAIKFLLSEVLELPV